MLKTYKVCVEDVEDEYSGHSLEEVEEFVKMDISIMEVFEDDRR